MKNGLILLFLFFICLPTSRVFAVDKVEINTASLQQLDKIIGIGPVSAQRIIDARPFSSIDDLLRIKGIGEKTLQKIKDQGLAYVEIDNTNQTTRIQITEGKQAEVLSPIIYPSGIVFNEILPSPKGQDQIEEWIELYNLNDFPVNLTNWQIRDKQGKIKTYTLPIGTKIGSKGFLLVLRPDSKIVLNNNGDGLELLDPNNNLADQISYEKALTGKSYSKGEEEWFWTDNMTPGEKNYSPEKPIKIESQTANIGEKIPKNQKSSVILIAIGTAIFSAMIILFLKKTLDKKSVLK